MIFLVSTFIASHAAEFNFKIQVSLKESTALRRSDFGQKGLFIYFDLYLSLYFCGMRQKRA